MHTWREARNFAWHRSLNRSWILKFEKFPEPDPDPDSSILEEERSLSLKKWLRPPLVKGDLIYFWFVENSGNVPKIRAKNFDIFNNIS